MDEESKITLTATNEQKWPNSILESLNTSRQSGHTLCNVFIRGEDEMEPIPAHQCVLAASSVYFNAMFTSGFVESKQDHREILIRGVDTEILSLIVEFLYVGRCRLPSGAMHRVMDLLAASNMLQVDELSNACTIYLEKCLDSDSALELWLFAESYGVSDLAKPCKRYVQSHFWSISRSQRVLELDRQHMAALLGLEEVNLGNAAKEDTLVELLLRWLTYNPKALDSDLLPVLRNVCWSEASQECKDKFREKLAEISKDSSSAEQVIDIISKSSSLIQSFKRRTFFYSVCAIGGLQTSKTSSMEVADIDTRTSTVFRHWSEEFKGGFCFLPFHGQLYALFNSNYNAKKPIDVIYLSVANIKNVKLLSPRRNDVESVWLKLNEKHHYAHAIDEERRVVYLCRYAALGESDKSNQVFKLDFKQNECSQLTSLPCGRSHHGAVVVEGDLFVLGGENRSSTPLSTVLKYDWMNKAWEEVSPMHEKRVAGAYACVGGCVYASGGWVSGLRSRNVEVYSPSLNIWTTLSPMSVPRVNHGLVAMGMYLFAMGGQSCPQKGVLRTVERYSIAEGCWKAAWEMAEGRQGMTAFTF